MADVLATVLPVRRVEIGWTAFLVALRPYRLGYPSSMHPGEIRGAQYSYHARTARRRCSLVVAIGQYTSSVEHASALPSAFRRLPKL
jgi:hypothetical protein